MEDSGKITSGIFGRLGESFAKITDKLSIEPEYVPSGQFSNATKQVAEQTQSQQVLLKLFSTLLATVASFGVTYIGIKWLTSALDPTKKDKDLAHRKAEEMLRHLGVTDVKLTDYELCIAANLVDPSSMSTSWEDIGGLEEVIEEIKESVIFPFRRPDLFLNSSLIQPPKGVLLYGPPGCGKTMIAKATARAADSFLRARSSQDHEATAMIKTQFMSLWDGIITDSRCQIMIIGATNRPQDVDAAILRRMPCMYRIGRPGKLQRIGILRKILAYEMVQDLDIDKLGAETEGFTGSDLKESCRLAALNRVHVLLQKAKEENEQCFYNVSVDRMEDLSMSDLELGVQKVKESKSSMANSLHQLQLD
ncbi:hypothetical protein KUTeg_003813 [Tegillarca granosa]|uniref:AAA+ ATPase domain-containing protein n=1 Tax=Tegillarca granosa TaxID=220873 RepID=A0ABQ9FQ08_TEGGR|nr:hypothetical protein KUTeg_003813 [Tegillarca granosa]